MWDSLQCGQVPVGGAVRAHWDPCASGDRVMETLLMTEERYLPSPGYLASVQSEPRNRQLLANWTLEVCCDSQCEEGVFSLSLALLDRVLSVLPVRPDSLQLLAAACLLVASKLRQSEALGARALCAASGLAFLPQELRGMERVVLTALRWDVAVVTPHDFLPHFLSALGLGGQQQQQEEEEEEQGGDFLPTVRRHADTLVALCACDARFLGLPPSVVAAATLCSALGGLGYGGPREGLAARLARLCRTEPAMLQFYSEQVEGALSDRLHPGQQLGRERAKEGEGAGARHMKEGAVEGGRASTPTDLREVDF
ncbi:cyclin Dx [Lepisosteus oculatus]|uniref:cyclin Dx n=1 Tax=Lepisosteus oculatus TaxID=7918 RepID=UPI00371EE44C